MGKLNAPQGDSTQGNQPDSGFITKIDPQKLDLKETLFKEIDLIQAVITRMANNSFQCKGWLIGILTLVIAIGKDSVFNSWFFTLVLLLPILVFWYLDGFFLYAEQRYRDLYNFTIQKRIEGQLQKQIDGKSPEQIEKEKDKIRIFFDLDYTPFEHQPLKGASFWTHFKEYRAKRKQPNPPVFHQPEIMLYPANTKPKTIVDLMVSKTIVPVYVLPIVFVFLLAIRSFLLEFHFFKPVDKKETFEIELASNTIDSLAQKLQSVIKVEVQSVEARPSNPNKEEATKNSTPNPATGKGQ